MTFLTFLPISSPLYPSAQASVTNTRAVSFNNRARGLGLGAGCAVGVPARWVPRRPLSLGGRHLLLPGPSHGRAPVCASLLPLVSKPPLLMRALAMLDQAPPSQRQSNSATYLKSPRQIQSSQRGAGTGDSDAWVWETPFSLWHPLPAPLLPRAPSSIPTSLQQLFGPRITLPRKELTINLVWMSSLEAFCQIAA